MRKIIVATTVVAALAIAGQAAAHARLLMATPKNGTTVAAPKALTLKFSEELIPASSMVKVTGPAAVSTGAMTLDKTKKIATLPFSTPLTPGAYKVDWHMKTEDGHETDGKFAFTVK